MRNGLSSKAKKTVIGVAMAVGSLGIGGAGVALLSGGNASAATSSSGSTASTSLTKAQELRRFLRRHAVDATVTIKTKTGYQTLDLARGTVGSVSSDSITVDSPNGTTLTATINEKTKFHNTTEAELSPGEKVGVLAYDGVARLVNTPKTASTPSS